MMAVTGRRRGVGALNMMVLMVMVQQMVGESILDFLRRRSDLSQVRGVSWNSWSGHSSSPQGGNNFTLIMARKTLIC